MKTRLHVLPSECFTVTRCRCRDCAVKLLHNTSHASTTQRHSAGTYSLRSTENRPMQGMSNNMYIPSRIIGVLWRYSTGGACTGVRDELLGSWRNGLRTHVVRMHHNIDRRLRSTCYLLVYAHDDASETHGGGVQVVDTSCSADLIPSHSKRLLLAGM